MDNIQRIMLLVYIIIALHGLLKEYLADLSFCAGQHKHLRCPEDRNSSLATLQRECLELTLVSLLSLVTDYKHLASGTHSARNYWRVF